MASSRSTTDDRSRRRIERDADQLQTAVRRQDGTSTPVGARALVTRARLLESAEKLFANGGFLSTALADIAKDAGVSLPTLYQYFADRTDIVAALAGESARRMLEAGVADWEPTSGRLGLRRAVGALVRMYWENRRFFGIWETASHAAPRLAKLRRDLESHHRRHFARLLADGVAEGLVRADLDPDAMSRAMTLMVASYCHDAFIFDPPDPIPTPDEVTDTLTALWADAIGLRERR